MRKLMFLLLGLFFLSFASSTTIPSVYDEIDDSSINWSLWANATSNPNPSKCTNSFSEDTDKITVNSAMNSQSGTCGSDIIAYSLSDLEYLENITFRANLQSIFSNSFGGSVCATENLIIFGNTVKTVQRCATVGTTSDDSVWMVIENSSNSSEYDIFDDGVYQTTIEALNKNISFETNVVNTEFPNINSRVDLYYMYVREKLNLTLNSPEDDLEKLINNEIVFNVSAQTETIHALVNATLYINGSINETKSLIGTLNTTTFTKTFSSAGLRNWSIEVCNNESICRTSDTREFTITRTEFSNFTFNNETNEGNTETFIVEVVTPDALSSASLIYDGVAQSTQIVQTASNNYTLTSSFTIPSVSADENKTFLWQVETSQGQQNSSSNNQTVLNYGIDDCSVFTNVLYNFTVVDETTQVQLDGSGDQVDSEVLVEIYDSSRSTLVSSFNKSYTSDSNFAVCLENNITDSSNQKLDLQVKYSGLNYVTEYYHIINDVLTNDDLNTNITLYDLDNSSSQTYTLSYKDASFLPVEGAVIQVQRKYISEGVFKTVEQPLTDGDGETVAHLVSEDVIYTFLIVVDNEVVATFDNVIAKCPNPNLQECTIDFLETSSFTDILDFSKVAGISFTTAYDKSTRTVSSIFRTLDVASAVMSLNVTLFDSFGNTTVCSNQLTSSSGTLSCVVPSSFGNATVVADLYKDGTHVAQWIIKIGEDPSDLYGASLVFLSLMIVLTLVGVSAVGSPIISGFFLMISLVILTGFNLIASTGWIGAGATILWFIVAVVIVIVKGANR